MLQIPCDVLSSAREVSGESTSISTELSTLKNLGWRLARYEFFLMVWVLLIPSLSQAMDKAKSCPQPLSLHFIVHTQC